MKTTLPMLLLTLILGLLYALGPAAADDQSGGSAGGAVNPGSGDDLFDAEFVEGCTREALDALEEGAQIVLPEAVPVVLLTAAEAKQRRRAYAESLGEDVGLTAAMDSMAEIMFADNMLGRYLPDERVVYVIEDVLLKYSGGDPALAEKKLFPVLAHELVHAYDHQVYDCVPAPDDLETMMADPSVLPQIQTQMSLIEGRATYASELACQAAGVRPMPSFSVEEAMDSELIRSDGSLGGDVVSSLGNSVLRLKMVQYAQGRTFAKRVYEFGGEKFFRQVFDALPLSMAELKDFNLFLVRWAENQEAAEDRRAAEEQQLAADQAGGTAAAVGETAQAADAGRAGGAEAAGASGP